MQLIALIKDASEFGKIGLTGVHQIIETVQDTDNVIYNAERDGFDRAFIYVHGLNAGKVLPGALMALRALRQCPDVKVLAPVGLIRDVWSQVFQALTFKQSRHVPMGGQYSEFFKKAAKLTKRKNVQYLCQIGLVACEVSGWE